MVKSSRLLRVRTVAHRVSARDRSSAVVPDAERGGEREQERRRPAAVQAVGEVESVRARARLRPSEHWRKHTHCVPRRVRWCFEALTSEAGVPLRVGKPKYSC